VIYMAWKRYFAGFTPKKRVVSAEVKFIVQDVEADIRITDIMFQDGVHLTGYVPANVELLKREPGVTFRRFNAVIRGRALVTVFNRAPVDQDDLTKRVTGGLDYRVRPMWNLPAGAVQLYHQYRTRSFKLKQALKAGDELYFSATRRMVAVNGVAIRAWEGHFHTIPGGHGRYEIELVDPETENPAGAAYVLFEVDTWLKGVGGERM